MIKMKRCAAAALAVMLSVSPIYGCGYVFAEEQSLSAGASANALKEDTVYINSAEEYVEFAKNCTLDSYSRGKTFILNTDINFSAEKVDFIPVPSFSGTFEGNGHKISGFSISDNGSVQGLFRYIEKSGRVKNVSVTCKISPSGTSSKSGAIAGVNRGTIYGCTVDGVVTGKEYCGGIAGVNEETGLISCCKVGGRIQAEHFTGGIAGENRGCIMLSENSASVNTDVSDSGLDIENINIDDIYSTEKSNDSTDAGGIAGYSSGNIIKCTNRGDVGYSHIGYNIGGICGRQNGYVNNCENYGTINGRKDTGGIVGQAEPHFSLLFSESSMQKLRDRLDELNVIVDKTIDDANNASDTVSGDIDTTLDSLKAVKNNTSDLMDMTDDILNDNIDSVNELSARVTDLIDMAKPASDSFTDASDAFSDAVDKLWEANDLLGDAMDNTDNALDTLFPALNDLSDALDALQDANDSMQDSLGTAQSSIGDSDGLAATLNNLKNQFYIIAQNVEAMSEIVKNLITALDDFNSSSDKSDAMDKIKDSLDRLQDSLDGVSDQLKEADDAIQRLQDLLDSNSDDADAYKECISEILDVFTGGAFEDMFDALSDLVDGVNDLVDSSAMDDVKNEIKKCADLIRNQGNASIPSDIDISKPDDITFDDLSTIIDYLMDTSSAVGDAEGAAGSLVDRIKEAWPFLDDGAAAAIAAAYTAEEAVQHTSDASVNLSDGMDQLRAINDYFAGKEKINFSGTDDEFDALRTSLSDNISDLLDNLDVLNASAGDSVNILSDDFKAMNAKASEVYDVIMDMSDELADDPKSLEDYTEDISSSDTEGRADGKIAGCTNNGQVLGDVSAGGIVGTMGIENSIDPEGDIEQKGDRSLNFIYQSRTVVRSCTNNGEVKSKKDCAGGIAGTMDTGCIINSYGYGNVSSTDGSYVGGIAGKSSSAIYGSYAMCRIEGDDYIGGIAGFAHDMSSCASYVTITESDEYSGAVAGDCDGDAEGNIFTENGTGGIDGVSYEGKAYPVPYSEICAMENIPEEFKSLTLTFMADDKVVDTIDFKYGDTISENKLPAPPKKTGYYAKWEEHDYENMTYGAVINAEYEPLITSISSDITREDGRSVFMAEGDFSDTDKLEVTDNGNENWSVVVPADGDGERTIRFLPETAPKKTMLRVDGVVTPFETDGSYIVFKVQSNGFAVTASKKPLNIPLIVGASGGGVALIAILATVIDRKKRKSKLNGGKTEETEKKKENKKEKAAK